MHENARHAHDGGYVHSARHNEILLINDTQGGRRFLVVERTRVDCAAMLQHAGSLGEALAAFGARVGFLLGVNHLVSRQLRKVRHGWTCVSRRFMRCDSIGVMSNDVTLWMKVWWRIQLIAKQIQSQSAKRLDE